MYDIVAIGELLIDFTPININNEEYFKQNPGGAPCNYLTMAQRLGSKTAFIGKVGNDNFGKYLKEILETNKINTDNLILSDEYNTTLAFVHLNESGERSFSFYRKNCADTKLEKKDINYELLNNTKVLHFGSLSFTNEPSRSTVLDVLDYCNNKEIIISYDPNYRPNLWNSKEEAVDSMKMGLDYCDILKVSKEESELITGEKDLLKACEKLYEYDIKIIFITLGERGAFYYHSNGYGCVNGKRSNVVDTTGAGDIFFGSAVNQIIQKGCNIEKLTNKDIEEIIHFSNTAASICVENYGGIPSIPTLDEIKLII